MRIPVVEEDDGTVEAEVEPGHYATVCPEKTEKNQEANLNETEEADALYVHEVVFLNEDKVIPKNLDIDKGSASVWYLDNGASNHMTGNKEFFSSLNLNTKWKVKFGDGSCVYIVGCLAGKQTRHSFPSVTHEEGVCDTCLAGKQTRHSFPSVTHEEGVCDTCLAGKQTRHSFPSVTHEEGVCDTCLAGKQTRHSFPSVTHEEGVCDTCLAGKQTRDSLLTKAMVRTSKPLRLLLGDLSGQTAPPTTADNHEAFYRFKRSHTDRGGELASAMFNLGCTNRGGEVASDVFNLGCTDRGGEIASDEFNLSCEKDLVEAMEDELESITRNKI
ncbi:PREDICTED: uncharacterized protein LOC106338485 [Brassica oleracea var. oleracea]|uniref:uncharacterized protein LOC106338485 n=1 Tax=Brassica oleracea var. oleracea TaxID=109376 RepID=UPI0006A71AB9|nr:PREDICTED: uncharacterized protein LOC106338485 [Brassica oleracea var. oleracea]